MMVIVVLVTMLVLMVWVGVPVGLVLASFVRVFVLVLVLVLVMRLVGVDVLCVVAAGQLVSVVMAAHVRGRQPGGNDATQYAVRLWF